eukprot:CAMPEP_0194308736 /NCGR_PEP_ID=MMETSP0171-20130528/5698_1 /TAXON_ID=218684 /ORGANISM="Corethron pennatum, Strain L29A3" /LENGTH=50 /DNA_ID=CAMNT_0039061517 /DNA_START=176 /DNA_END=325 /DNA_ORIENTATION=-
MTEFPEMAINSPKRDRSPVMVPTRVTSYPSESAPFGGGGLKPPENSKTST